MQRYPSKPSLRPCWLEKLRHCNIHRATIRARASQAKWLRPSATALSAANTVAAWLEHLQSWRQPKC